MVVTDITPAALVALLAFAYILMTRNVLMCVSFLISVQVVLLLFVDSIVNDGASVVSLPSKGVVVEEGLTFVLVEKLFLSRLVSATRRSSGQNMENLTGLVVKIRVQTWIR